MNRFQLKNRSALKRSLLAASVLGLAATSAAAYDGSGTDYYQYDGGMAIESPDGLGGPASPGPSLGFGFDGVSQVDVRALHSNFSEIPPDTMGAVGATQFMETSNGAYAVYNKTTGAQEELIGDGAFWQAAGQPIGSNGFSNGDSRVLYNAQYQRWVVESFAANVQNIQIAVSDTSDATGTWHSVQFQSYSDGMGSGIADYPTLAMDSKAIYIGTNDFSAPASGPTGCPINSIEFCGTTLNVISTADIFAAGGPKVSSLKQFYTPFDGSAAGDRGFAIQGVNQVNGVDVGKVIAIAANDFGPLTYSVNNPGTAGATESAKVTVDNTPYAPNQMAEQPDGTRNIDALDDRFSSSAYEYNGKIYEVHTITPIGSNHSVLEYYVIDATTNAVIQKGVIGDGVHDFFQGAIAINSAGQAMIEYNESGTDMNVSILAQQFNTNAKGALYAVGSAILLKVSPIDDYHNGSVQSAAAVGRQRWGDYAQVTVDPNNPQSFWVIGEYALGYLPSATASFSRWGTWISDLNVAALPEPGTWGLMIMGAGMIGGAMRRQRKLAAA
jgi:hypothetical protein